MQLRPQMYFSAVTASLIASHRPQVGVSFPPIFTPLVHVSFHKQHMCLYF